MFAQVYLLHKTRILSRRIIITAFFSHYNAFLGLGARRLCTLCLCLLALNTVRAQQSESDSLLRIINSSPEDTTKVNLLVDYAWTIISQPVERPNRRLLRAVQLARSLDFQKGEADALNALGVHNAIIGNLDSAIICYELALPIRQKLNDKKGVASLYNNLGNAYGSLNRMDKALENLQNNLRTVQELGDSARIARSYFNIAQVRADMRDFTGASDAANNYRLYAEKNNNAEGKAKVYILLGNLRFDVNQFEPAKSWYEKALAIRRTLGDENDIASALNSLGNAQSELGDHTAAIMSYQEALYLFEKTGDTYEQARVLHNLASAYRELPNYEQATQYVNQAIELREGFDDPQAWMETQETYADLLYDQSKVDASLKVVLGYLKKAEDVGDRKFIEKAYKDLSKIYAKKKQYERAYHYRKDYDELRDELFDEQRNQAYERSQALFSNKQNEWALESQKRDLKEKEAQIKQDRIQRNALFGGAFALAAIAALLFYLNRVRGKANEEMDRLLKNILPESTAEELKANNSVAPVRYQSVSVLFTDFVGFTRIAEKMEPEDLVAELDAAFRLFDEIVERHNLEKIKTIGDAYMCAGGLPNINKTHPIDTVNAAFEMQAALHKLMESRRQKGEPVFEMRLGIHTGPVVAGVVGSHKFAYDIWGDTVNTASRMESNSEAGKVNISAATFELVKEQFTCTYRGKLEAKNKGAIDMYFVEGVK